MIQGNEQTALLMWQAREMVRLHAAFIKDLKVACLKATLENKPIDINGLGHRIDALEAACDQVLQKTAILVKEKN